MMLTKISEARFSTRYPLGRQVSAQGGRSFEARDATGRLVMVHFLGSVEDPAARTRLGRLSALPPERQTGLVGAFQINDEAVLVTGFLPHIRSFDDWYVSIAGEQTVVDSPAAATEPTVRYDGPPRAPEPLVQSQAGADDRAAGDQPGEFTRMFKPIKEDSTNGATDEIQREIITSLGDSVEPGEKQPAAQQTQPEQSGRQPGEFTRMFGALPEEVPQPPPVMPKGRSTVEELASPGTPAPGPAERSDGFTEVFGPRERTETGPGQAQPLVEPPDQTGLAKQDGEERRPDEPRPAAPRIVWRGRTPEETPPDHEAPKIKIKWKQDLPPAAADATPQHTAPEPQVPSEQRPAPRSRPPGPTPESPPGEFTEVFGKALTPGSEPSVPGPSSSGLGIEDKFERLPDAHPWSDRTAAPQSAGDRVAPLDERASSDYLRALNDDSRIPPSPAAPVPESVLHQQSHSPADLPPPVSPAPKAAPEPSEYTRMMSGRPVEPAEVPRQAAPTASPVAESAEPTEAKAPTWLWISLVAIALAAVLLIVLIALT